MIILKLKNIGDLKAKAKGRSILLACGLCPYWNYSEEDVAEVGEKLNSKVVKLPMICNHPEITVDPDDYDTVFVLACGAGSQVVSDVLERDIIPVADTTGIGIKKDDKIIDYCSACGNCILDETAGICPIKRCSKSLLNGPCGGVQDGKCEVGDIDCGWILIQKRIEKEKLISVRKPRSRK